MPDKKITLTFVVDGIYTSSVENMVMLMTNQSELTFTNGEGDYDGFMTVGEVKAEIEDA